MLGCALLRTCLADRLDLALPDVRHEPSHSLLITAGPVPCPHAKILESLPEVIFATNADGAWTYLNPAWTRVTGFPVRSSLGRSFLDFIWPATVIAARTSSPGCSGVSGRSRHEVRYRTDAGGHRWVEVNASLDHDRDGRLIGTYGSITDITDRKQAEIALRQRERELQDAQRIARMGHWRLDLSTGECEWSAGVYHLMRMSPVEYRPTLDDIMCRIHEDDRDETARRLAECVGTGSPMEWQYRIRDGSNRELILQAEGHCEFDDGGHSRRLRDLPRRNSRPGSQGDADGRQRGGGGGEPSQIQVPGEHEPRVADALERHHRVQ